MSEVNLENATKEQLLVAAEKLGLTVDGRLGADKIREEIAAELEVRKEAEARAVANAARLAAEKAAEEAEADNNSIQSPVEPTKMPSLADVMAAEAAPVDLTNESEGHRKNRLRREATALVRVRVSSMNPQKKNVKGELLCVSNRNIGTIQRYIPFNRDWHIEKVLYDALMAKEFMVFDREKTGRAGIEVVTPRCIPEFNIQVLPPLTKNELKDLAQRQAMAAGTGQE
jgi:hypothetical protein